MFDHASILASLQLEVGLLRDRVTRLENVPPADPPAKRYRDVTAESRIECGHVVIHDGWARLKGTTAVDGYRLRKVSRGELFPGDSAFIIEKEEA